MNHKQVSRKTYDKNVKSGKWAELSKPSQNGGFIETTSSTRGVYNAAGRVFHVDFMLDKKERAGFSIA